MSWLWNGFRSYISGTLWNRHSPNGTRGLGRISIIISGRRRIRTANLFLVKEMHYQIVLYAQWNGPDGKIWTCINPISAKADVQLQSGAVPIGYVRIRSGSAGNWTQIIGSTDRYDTVTPRNPECGYRESNPDEEVGNLPCYHWTSYPQWSWSHWQDSNLQSETYKVPALTQFSYSGIGARREELHLPNHIWHTERCATPIQPFPGMIEQAVLLQCYFLKNCTRPSTPGIINMNISEGREIWTPITESSVRHSPRLSYSLI